MQEDAQSEGIGLLTSVEEGRSHGQNHSTGAIYQCNPHQVDP